MTTPHHVPVLLDRVVALLAPALERPASERDRPGAGRRHPRPRRAHRGGADPLRPGPGGRHRPGPPGADDGADRLAPYGDRFTGVHAVYDEIPDVLADLGLAEVDAVLFDLGVSSMQLDVRERGFAYAEDAPLDMRMDGSTGPTAADVLNTYSAAELTRVLRDYGEEKFARKIAAAVVRQREQQPFTTSARLVELLYAEIPAPARRTGGHPAKRTFQALRMEVNDELAVLRRAIPAAIDAIGVGGRVVVESYHSLEDRLVKQAFTAVTRSTRARGPAVRAGRAASRRCAWSPGAPSRPTPARSSRTPAPPPSGCGRSNASTRHPPSSDHQRSRTMSSPAVQARSRVPRIAEAAVERARLTVVPRRRTRPPPGCRSSPWSAWCCSAASWGCCSSTPPCSRPRSPPPRSRARPSTSRRASRPWRWSSRSCATRSGSPPSRRARAWCCPQPRRCSSLGRPGEVPGEATAGRRGRPGRRLRGARRPGCRAVLNPPRPGRARSDPAAGGHPAGREPATATRAENNGRRGRGTGRNG